MIFKRLKSLYFLSLLGMACAWSGLNGQSLPSSYDLRAVSTSDGTEAWVPAIQDQGYFGDCWTFAGATAMDSNLLMNGLLPTSSTAPTIQISSWALSTQNGAPESLIGPNYGGDGQHTWGGLEYQTLGYVSRGQGTWAIPGVNQSSTTLITTMGGGPVLDSTSGNAFPSVFQNSTPADIHDLLPTTNQTPAYQVRSVVMLDQGAGNNVPLPIPVSGNYSFDQGAADPQVQAVKNAILSYGAVTTSMNATDYSSFKYVSNGNGTYTVNYFNPSTVPSNIDHEVTIIGWNDSYQMTDPNTGVTTTGAWIVQNSWGTSGWGGSNKVNDGTFYAAYNDAAIGRTGVAAYQVGSAAHYSPTVIQNELGPIGASSNYIAANNVLGMAALHQQTVAGILTPGQNGMLTALGISTQLKDVTVQISIYSNWLNGPSGTLLEQMSVNLTGIGYSLIDLTSDISLLANDPLIVELEYSLTDAVPIVIGDSVLGGFSTPDGLSYYYDTGTSTWIDLATETYAAYEGYGPDAQGGVLFLKGFTAVPEPETYALLLAAGGVLAFAVRRKR